MILMQLLNDGAHIGNSNSQWRTGICLADASYRVECRRDYVGVLPLSEFELHRQARYRHRLCENDSNAKVEQDRAPLLEIG